MLFYLGEKKKIAVLFFPFIFIRPLHPEMSVAKLSQRSQKEKLPAGKYDPSHSIPWDLERKLIQERRKIRHLKIKAICTDPD